MSAAYIILAGLFLAGLLFRDAYEVLKKRGRIDTKDTRIFVMTFAAMIVMWISWFIMGFLSATRLPIPDILRWSGLAAAVIGVFLVVGGMWQLKGVENIDHLVTEGLFSKIRHPMYTGFVLWILGLALYSGALVGLIVGALGLVSILWWRYLEEEAMVASYGEEYMDYRAKTWF